MIYNEMRVLPDGLVIGSGENANIRKCSVTRLVNDGQELMPGSVCAAQLDATVQMAEQISAGSVVALEQLGDDGRRVQVGQFVLEQPTRMGDVLYRLVGYDAVVKLDRDLGQWLQELDGWPYTLSRFAELVCQACGLELAMEQIPNGEYPVRKFYKSGVTGRQIMGWIGELACRFIYADEEGRIRFGWYGDRGVRITPGGENFYFAGGLRYEDYAVAPIDGVRVRLASSDSGGLWPEGTADNPYIFRYNPIALAQVDQQLQSALEVVAAELAALPRYRPCCVEVLAGTDVKVGDVVSVEDRQGSVFSMLVMSSRIWGQRMVLECTGSARRDSTTAANNRSPGQIAQEAVDRQSQAELFHKLTDGGKVQGLMLGEDGNIYLNVTYASTGVLASKDGNTFYLDLDNGVLKMHASELYIGGKSVSEIAGGKVDAMTAEELFSKLTDNGKIQGIQMVDGKWYINASVVGTGRLVSADGLTYFDLDAGEIVATDLNGAKVVLHGSGVTWYNAEGDRRLRIFSDSDGTRIQFIASEGGSPTPWLGVHDGELCLFANDLDYSTPIPVAYKVGWKKVNGEKVLVGYE